MTVTDTLTSMRERLATLEPLSMDIADDSAQHAGHEGARAGGGHYRLMMISAHFSGKGTLERHRLIYDALGPMMRAEIHALSIQALTPEETR